LLSDGAGGGGEIVAAAVEGPRAVLPETGICPNRTQENAIKINPDPAE
jgi:hypothetical protein